MACSPFSPVPPAENKEQEQGEVGRQQCQVEGTIQEEGLGEEAPVHCPAEEKLAAKVKGAGEVTDGILQQEGQPQYHLRMGVMSTESPRLTPSIILIRSVGIGCRSQRFLNFHQLKQESKSPPLPLPNPGAKEAEKADNESALSHKWAELERPYETI